MQLFDYVRVPRRSLTDWAKALDAYTLWAFNPQPPLAIAPDRRLAGAVGAPQGN